MPGEARLPDSLSYQVVGAGMLAKWAIGTVLAMLGVGATLHTAVAMPMLRTVVLQVTEERIDKYHDQHILHVHPGALTKEDWDRESKLVNTQLQSMQSQLSRMETELANTRSDLLAEIRDLRNRDQ
jgi:hypothetical protein